MTSATINRTFFTDRRLWIGAAADTVRGAVFGFHVGLLLSGTVAILAAQWGKPAPTLDAFGSFLSWGVAFGLTYTALRRMASLVPRVFYQPSIRVLVYTLIGLGALVGVVTVLSQALAGPLPLWTGPVVGVFAAECLACRRAVRA